MAIVQISKIQQRSGNLVDLPQLDEAEFGWASDAKRLFIGKTATGGSIENVEVLTSYSNISFSQIDGAVGNLDISALSAGNGQVLTYDGVNWVNRGGNAGGIVNLGNVANVKIGSGAIGYVLTTDGTGNLSWSPKGTLYTNIISLSNATPIVMKVANTTPYTNGQSITISGVNGTANANVNGRTFYVKVSNNFATSGDVSLYNSSDLSNAAVGTSLTYTNSPNAIATAVISAGAGSAAAGGVNTNIQYNANGIIAGDAGFSFTSSTKSMTLTGNATVGNLNTAGRVVASILTSNVATGTAPLIVTSTTRVSNLNVATAGVANTVNDSSQPNITSVGTLSSVSVSGNANVGNLGTAGLITATGNLNAGNIITGGLITATGNLNVGNIGTIGAISATGNANVGNLGTAGLITATGNIRGANLITTGVISATGNLNASNIITGGIVSATGNGTFGNVTGGNLVSATFLSGTLITTAQPNITATGTLVSLSVSGNANVGNLGTAGLITATGNLNAGNIITGGLITATGNGTFGNVNTTTLTGNTVSVTGNATAGNLVTGGIVSASGNASVLGIKTDNYYYANGVAVSFSGTYSNSNVASYLPTFTGTVGARALTTGANTTTGTITGNWSLTAGSRLDATYADLAEYYEADAEYKPGTVLEFGGDKEVTVAEDGTTRVAGVVSTDPAYAMNAKCPGQFVVAIALQGRVPTKVRGTIRKGDMMVSAGNGFARPSNNPQMGTVIGKALQDFDGIEGVIEVAVGRL